MELTRLAWHHFIFRAPRTWEVIGYTKHPWSGQLVLADRNGETMRVSWKEIKRKPALTRALISLVKANQETAQKEGDIRACIQDIGEWTAYTPDDADAPVFAAVYLPDAKVVLQVTFPPHVDTEDRALVREVLCSFKPNHGDERVWAAFGLDFALPKEMELDEVICVLATQVMRLENRRGESVMVHRYGMVPAVLGEDDLATFFARVKGKRYLLYKDGDFLKDGKYPGVRMSYHTHGKGGFESFIAPRWEGRVWVWRCDDIKRIFAVDNNAREDHLIEDLPDRVRCQ